MAVTFRLDICDYGADAVGGVPMRAVWLTRRDGAASSSALQGEMTLTRADELAAWFAALGGEVRRDEDPALRAFAAAKAGLFDAQAEADSRSGLEARQVPAEPAAVAGLFDDPDVVEE